MRFCYAESMTDPSFYAPLARAAEEAGFASMMIPDSICYPRRADSRYPFNPDGSREFLEDKPFLEPFSLIPALGAVTRQLRFITFVLKLPVRHPVLAAKQATSTAVLTGDRLVLGVGTSPWREDYDVLGVDWATRGERLDEEIAILRGLAAGGYFEYHGKIFDLPPVKISPVPAKPIPVLIGGHSDAALRRAARLGDGWLHGGGDLAELPALLAPPGRTSPHRRHRRPPVRDPRDLRRCLHRGRHSPPDRPGRHRRDHRLPLALPHRPGPRAPARQAHQAPPLRRHHNRPRPQLRLDRATRTSPIRTPSPATRPSHLHVSLAGTRPAD